ncbi:hypothetical protein [Aliiroseovarius sp.]|uniref:hypothetical protein n=1 Tax=Aliiroseovarius sp. TaxID=1872442 RepID=UPI003BAB13D2
MSETIVSLTSIPPRFAQLPRVVATLQAQGAQVIVTLPRRYRRFPGDHAVPDLPGAEVLRPDGDLGPAAKVVHAAQRLRGQDVDLLYCDDDWDYAPGWVDAFRKARLAHPGAVLAGATFGAERLKLSGPPIVQGFAGVMIQPDWLDDLAMTLPEIAWAVDDIWLSGAFARAGRAVVELPEARRLATPLADPGNLQAAQVDGQTRAEANRACALHLAARFGTWRPL